MYSISMSECECRTSTNCVGCSKNGFRPKSFSYSACSPPCTHHALIQAAEVPEFAAMDEQVSPTAEVIVFVHVLGSLLARVGTRIDKVVLVQMSALLTQVVALEIDSAARANLVSMLELSGEPSPSHDHTRATIHTTSLQQVIYMSM